MIGRWRHKHVVTHRYCISIDHLFVNKIFAPSTCTLIVTAKTIEKIAKTYVKRYHDIVDGYIAKLMAGIIQGSGL